MCEKDTYSPTGKIYISVQAGSVVRSIGRGTKIKCFLFDVFEFLFRKLYNT